MEKAKIRPIKFQRDYIKHAEGSCLFQMGNTKVLCVATAEDRIPPFLEGKGKGWVTAEYAMLPRAGKQRNSRGRGSGGGRTQEIQRIIGRALRGVIDLEKIGLRTIIIDCDVIQADGGTRTTAINGSFIALTDAIRKLMKEDKITEWPVKDYIGAISVGKVDGELVLDLCADEDNNAEVDMNVVMTGKGKFIEIQGTAEKVSFSNKELTQMLELAKQGINQIIDFEKKIVDKIK